jgi:hypothetical protein
MTAAKRPPNRAYHRHGQGVVAKALPYLLERVAESTLPDETLTPLELAARQWHREAERDLGGVDTIAATKRALLDAATGSMILLASLDRYVFALAAADGLVNRRSRRVFPVVESRMRVADGLTRQLQALGLEPRRRDVPSLAEYVQAKYGRAADETPQRHQEPRSAGSEGQAAPQSNLAPAGHTGAPSRVVPEGASEPHHPEGGNVS